MAAHQKANGENVMKINGGEENENEMAKMWQSFSVYWRSIYSGRNPVMKMYWPAKCEMSQ